MYKVIDLLSGEVVFEGSAKDCINFVNQNGPSYDILPMGQEHILNVFQTTVMFLLTVGILIWYLIWKML